jgi:hypothetical protein
MFHMNENEKWLEKIFWSIAFPGLGQLLNGKLLKGLLFIALEFMINAGSNLNEIILLSFQGKTLQAVESTNYKWLMFYPCIYIYAIWDAYKDSGGAKSPFAFIPFVLSAYLGTIGVIYSSVFNIKGVLLGPLWLSILSFISGIFIGIIIQYLLILYYKRLSVSSRKK